MKKLGDLGEKLLPTKPPTKEAPDTALQKILKKIHASIYRKIDRIVGNDTDTPFFTKGKPIDINELPPTLTFLLVQGDTDLEHVDLSKMSQLSAITIQGKGTKTLHGKNLPPQLEDLMTIDSNEINIENTDLRHTSITDLSVGNGTQKLYAKNLPPTLKILIASRQFKETNEEPLNRGRKELGQKKIFVGDVY